MENTTISNQSSIENNEIEVIEGEEIQLSTLFEQSCAVVKNNDGHYSNKNDSDNSEIESKADLRNTSTSNAGESEYESANEEELLFQNNNFNDNDDANLEQHQQQSLSDGKIDDNSYVVQKENDDDDNHVEEKKELTDNIGEDVKCDGVDEEDNESVKDDKQNIIDNCQETNKNENLREYGDGEETIPSKNNAIKPVLDDKTNKECMINTTNATQPKSLPKSAKLSKAELFKAKRNPQYVPRKGSYFQHDVRGNDEDGTKNKKNDEPLNVIGEEHLMNDSVNDQNVKTTSAIGKKSMLSSMKLCSDDLNDSVYDHQSQKSDQDQQDGKSLHEDNGEKWQHDKFNEEEQNSKTREELFDIYGYDIRAKKEAPPYTRWSDYYFRMINKRF